MGKTFKDQARVRGELDRFNEVVEHAHQRRHGPRHEPEPSAEYVEAPDRPEWELEEVQS